MSARSVLPGRTGFTLIEVIIAAVLLSGAVLGFMALIPEVTRLTEATYESDLALNASLQVSEALRQYADQSFAYTWRVYNDDPTDDPNGHGTAPGSLFSVSGLLNAGGSNQVGSITFYTDETADNASVGLPKDLDSIPGNNSTNVSNSYTLLPFKISVDWKDHAGLQRHTEIYSQVAEY